jgi:hypothetical protein
MTSWSLILTEISQILSSLLLTQYVFYINVYVYFQKYEDLYVNNCTHINSKYENYVRSGRRWNRAEVGAEVKTYMILFLPCTT